jgi:CheY-like chemotaxis protein
MLAVKAQEKALEIVCLVSPDVPSLLRGDPGRLRQVIVNLAGNAIKFTDRGEVTVRVSADGGDGTMVTLRFSVADTGIGIPRHRQATLFSPFTQGDSSTTRKYGGTGLGLAISKQLVELMGGHIGVVSEEGAGSTFWFTAAFEKQAICQSAAPPGPADLRAARVLVVDDHETNRLLVTTLLDSWGCACGEAAGGEAALSLLRAAAREDRPYEAALVDMYMPGMDGMTLGARIKADPDIRRTALIMMTSLGQRGEAAKIREAGFSGYLTKPIRRTQLRECIALALGRAAKAEDALPEALITRHTIAESRAPGVRMLLAEDDRVNQTVFAAMLKKLGYSTDVAANGREAVQAAAGQRYDLIFMDCQMPEMDGYEATRRIRKLEPSHVHTPIIAVTANAMAGTRQTCLDAGMDDYLTKPVRKEELAGAIVRWLSPGPSPGQQEAGDDPRSTDGGTVTARAAELRAMAEALAPHLKAHKPKKCSEVMAGIMDRAWPDHLQPDVGRLDYLVGRYRFEQAAALVEELCRKIDTGEKSEGAI